MAINTIIEEKYKEMDEVSHILNRPGMYVGSTKEEDKEMFIYNSDRDCMEMTIVSYVPAMLKAERLGLSSNSDEIVES